MEKFIKPSNMSYPHLKAMFTTRSTGSSIRDIVSQFNAVEDDFYFPIQRHTNRVYVLGKDRKKVVADAIVTDRKKVFIGVQVADCVPILLYDKGRFVIGAVHAGWRGTAQQILKKTISEMHRHFGTNPEDLVVAMGPAIGKCCYEVDFDVMESVRKASGSWNYYSKKGNKYFIDLHDANKKQALSEGVFVKNIWQSRLCTHCEPERFYSYRYAGYRKGRQFGIIGMW
jgi:hypothetical protein